MEHSPGPTAEKPCGAFLGLATLPFWVLAPFLHGLLGAVLSFLSHSVSVHVFPSCPPGSASIVVSPAELPGIAEVLNPMSPESAHKGHNSPLSSSIAFSSLHRCASVHRPRCPVLSSAGRYLSNSFCGPQTRPPVGLCVLGFDSWTKGVGTGFVFVLCFVFCFSTFST